jgi:hypothetical protein
VLVVRKPGGSEEVDYWLKFNVPQVPCVGDYISIQRPDKPPPYGEDMIVRHVWWRLSHPETEAILREN